MKPLAPEMVERIPEGTFYGTTVKRMHIPGLALSETIYPPSLEIPPHFHERSNFCFVLAGAYDETSGREVRRCEGSTLVYHPKGEVHSDKHANVNARIFCVELDDSCVDSLRAHPLTIDSPACIRDGVTASLSSRLYREFRLADDLSPLAIEALVSETLVLASRKRVSNVGREGQYWLTKVEELLRSRYAESISLAAIAKEVGVHPVHLARTFREKHRCTIGEYVRHIRIEAACKLLADAQQPLGDVALAVGFADQSHFTRSFKAVMDSTPSGYRRAILR